MWGLAARGRAPVGGRKESPRLLAKGGLIWRTARQTTTTNHTPNSWLAIICINLLENAKRAGWGEQAQGAPFRPLHLPGAYSLAATASAVSLVCHPDTLVRLTPARLTVKVIQPSRAER